MQRYFVLGLLMVGTITACAAPKQEVSAGGSTDVGMGRMGELSSDMMDRHHASIPEEYTEVSASIASPESVERGAEVYAIHCMTCHGGSGMGDGPGGTGLDPAPAPIARTSQRMSDSYLYWRISEGGVSFETAMPAWEDTLDEQERWDVIHYVRALGSSEAEPASDIGQAYDPQAQADQQAAMLAQAVEVGMITRAEAEVFAEVHTLLEA